MQMIFEPQRGDTLTAGHEHIAVKIELVARGTTHLDGIDVRR
jgi:hypothetical protein